jgi:hypothetical protein
VLLSGKIGNLLQDEQDLKNYIESDIYQYFQSDLLTNCQKIRVQFSSLAIQSCENILTVEIGDTLFEDNTLYTGQSLNASTDCYATLKPDGNFVLIHTLNGTEIEKWSSKTNTSTAPKPFKLTMQTDGNLVLYDVNGHAVWASDTQNSGEARHRLIRQSDGNLVIYAKNNEPTWSSKTNSNFNIMKAKLKKI